MPETAATRPAGNYGIDAPWLPTVPAATMRNADAAGGGPIPE
ncbi:MAG: hypothetical protein QOE51_3962 [Actinoplanes sp.]|jgi:hypothetical protein|nr:hypothetical protein [Actinoplanes sp.]